MLKYVKIKVAVTEVLFFNLNIFSDITDVEKTQAKQTDVSYYASVQHSGACHRTV